MTFEDDADMRHCLLDMDRVAEADFADDLDHWFAKWKHKLRDLLDRGDLAAEADHFADEVEARKVELHACAEETKEITAAITEAIGYLKTENLRRKNVADAISVLEEAIAEPAK